MMTTYATIRNSVAPTMEILNLNFASDLPVQSVNDIECVEESAFASQLLEQVWTMTEELPVHLYLVDDAEKADACESVMKRMHGKLTQLTGLFRETDYSGASVKYAEWVGELLQRFDEIPA